MRSSLAGLLALSLPFVAACATEAGPAADEAEREAANVEFVQGIYGAFAEGDVPTVLASLASDVRWTEAEGFPYAGTYTGPESVRDEVFAKLGSEWDGYRAEPSEFIADGETVVALGEYSGTYRETGTSFRAPFAHIWTVENGQVVRFRQMTDTELVQRALRGESP